MPAKKSAKPPTEAIMVLSTGKVLSAAEVREVLKMMPAAAPAVVPGYPYYPQPFFHEPPQLPQLPTSPPQTVWFSKSHAAL